VTTSLAARLRELWDYRNLVYNLVVRDLKVRYKNSVLGILWSLLNPLLMMLVFTFVFNVLAGSSGLPAYPAFVLSGILAWNLFATSIGGAITSIVSNAHLIKKVYFPREVLPISVVLANLVNYLLALPVYFILAILLGRDPTLWVLLLPAVILIQLFFTLGVSFILATLNVFYRDTQIVMEVVLLAWFFMTPIFYPISQVAPNGLRIASLGLELSSFDIQRWLRIVNPMASIVASYRDILYWGAQPGIDFFLRTAATSLFFLVAGYLIFQRFCPVFGEEI
jgi:ABC-type polysaccharide/polyol phosphate export permease